MDSLFDTALADTRRALRDLTEAAKGDPGCQNNHVLTYIEGAARMVNSADREYGLRREALKGGDFPVTTAPESQ